MYNILLTDDEQIVIDSLTLILTRAFGEEVKLFTALSGVQALEIVRKEKIDIIFMDIHMPGLNGLETIGLIKQVNPNIVITILSAYDQFHYAQEALNLGAFKYLTKPLKRDAITETVRNAMSLVDTKRGVLSNNIELHEKLNFVSSIVESDFIYSCIFSNSSTDFSSYMDYFGLADVSFFMCCIELPVTEKEKRFDAYNKVRDILTSKSRCIVGSFMTNRIGVFFPFKKEESENVLERQRNLIETVYSLLATKITAKIRIGVSEIDDNIQNASHIYNNALSALNSTDSSGGLTFYTEMIASSDSNQNIQRIKELSQKIVNRIHVADAGSVRSLVTEYMNLLEASYSAQFDILKNHVFEFLFLIRNTVLQINPGYKNQAFDKAFSTLAATNDRQQIEQFIYERCLECITAIAGLQEKKVNPIIEKACVYIEQNLASDFGLEQVASAMNVSSFYLSKLFKEETGENFISYVTSLRLEKAKALLGDDSLIIKEITAMVGYNDQNYFSKLFKQKFGSSPSEYRDSIIKTAKLTGK